ncbi:hypothetical protein D3C78_1964630 [compost metagenome]
MVPVAAYTTDQRALGAPLTDTPSAAGRKLAESAWKMIALLAITRNPSTPWS